MFGLLESNRSVQVHCILSNAEITRSLDQNGAQEVVSIADKWVKSASMISVEIMVSFHLIKTQATGGCSQLFLIKSCHPKYTGTQMLYGICVSAYSGWDNAELIIIAYNTQLPAGCWYNKLS